MSSTAAAFSREGFEHLAALRSAIEGALEGKSEAVDLAIIALLARGHILIEDVPGVGKTTLAHTLARVLGLRWFAWLG